MLFAGAMLFASSAIAQAPQPFPFDSGRPLIMRAPADAPGRSQREMKPLDPIQMQILQDIERERDNGRFDMARKKLAALPAEVQKHPLVLTERVRIELAASNFAEAARIATAERRAQKDSLLLGRELVEASERLSRMREASATAVEVWAAAPVEENWAMSVLARLGRIDDHAGRDAMRRAFARETGRHDLARGLAYLEWAAGDMRAALKPLRQVEQRERGPRDRWGFAELLLQLGTVKDTTGAAEVYADVAADQRLDATYRMTAARRAWELAGIRGQHTAVAPRLYQALKDVPRDRWMGDLSLALARSLRLAGDTGAARALLGPAGPEDAGRPELNVERSLADLRDGPPERVLESLKPGSLAGDEQRFHYAEALFFAGQPDSALVWYKTVAQNPGGTYTGAALERIFLIEDGNPRSALPVLGRIAYEQWRGASKRALVLADSLWHALPRGPLWAQTAMRLSEERERAGDAQGALVAVLAVADSLPDDRLAPLARQRAGDLYAGRLKDEAKAIEQYEACVARYPRAWNAPEVRRRLEELRRTRRF